MSNCSNESFAISIDNFVKLLKKLEAIKEEVMENCCDIHCTKPEAKNTEEKKLESDLKIVEIVYKDLIKSLVFLKSIDGGIRTERCIIKESEDSIRIAINNLKTTLDICSKKNTEEEQTEAKKPEEEIDYEQEMKDIIILLDNALERMDLIKDCGANSDDLEYVERGIYIAESHLELIYNEHFKKCSNRK